MNTGIESLSDSPQPKDGELLALADEIENWDCIGSEQITGWALRLRTLASRRVTDEVEYEYEVFQNDEWQAGGSTTTLESAVAECSHYAMMYGQDGPVEVRYYAKRRVSDAEVAALQPDTPSKSQVKRIAIEKGGAYPYDADGNRVQPDSGEVGNG